MISDGQTLLVLTCPESLDGHRKAPTLEEMM